MAKDTMDEINDPRFRSVYTDPRFLRQPKNRFKSLSTASLDQRFFKTVDSKIKKVKRGGETSVAKKRNEETKSYKRPARFIDYARGEVLLESSDEDEEDGDKDVEQRIKKIEFDSTDFETSSDDEDEDVELGPSSSRNKVQKSEIIDEIDLDEDNDDEFDDQSDQESNRIHPTKRIAIVNLDWDNVKPIDIYKVFTSLVSQTGSSTVQSSSKQSITKGQILKVSFYKSQFGKERMKKEDIEGPPREIFKKPDTQSTASRSYRTLNNPDSDLGSDQDDLIEEDEGGDFDEEALRRYQLERLRYFYAIVELDSVDASSHVFNEIDGTEFERTANVFDLSYVPDDMTFDPDDLHDECVEDAIDYKPVDFSTDALRHSKVKLTWDAEDPHRAKITRLNTQKMTREELDQINFSSLVAPPSSEEEQEKEEVRPSLDRERLRKLLGLEDQRKSSEKQASAPDLDIVFTPAFSTAKATVASSSKTRNKSPEIADPLNTRVATSSSNSVINNTSNMKKRQASSSINSDEVDSSENPSNEKELDLLFDEDKEDNHQHFDLNQIIKIEKLKNKPKALKRLKKKDERIKDLAENSKDGFNIDADDHRFSKVFDDHEFAIDPSNPQYKPTSNMEKLLETSRKRSKKGTNQKETIKKIDDGPQNDPDQERLRINQLMDSLKKKCKPVDQLRRSK
ncbi:hypothetical protein PPACK8108_LOCUS13862 [Phakopsora pachyrhizi]|uniref:NUC153 domain-containing protein n=1 Tax=Phakopsora pachyrhizi TaxID=170000 RepID=A0AAV0B3Q9_PHAPC|nr:hypothetical protein PPACK8108_LOCUS13862 [Phakopsora pachyrhizi]